MKHDDHAVLYRVLGAHQVLPTEAFQFYLLNPISSHDNNNVHLLLK